MKFCFQGIVGSAAFLVSVFAAGPTHKRPVVFEQPTDVERGSIQNIHVKYHGDVNGELAIVYGSCGLNSLAAVHDHVGTTHIGTHPLAARHTDWNAQRPNRFVWITPADMSPGCLHAFLDGEHVGRSEELTTVKQRAPVRRQTSFADVADPMGPWFDGVAYLKQKQPNETFVASTKSKRFGILGAGIAGLTTGVSPIYIPPSLSTHRYFMEGF